MSSRGLLNLALVAAIGYGGYVGYQRWQQQRDPRDIAEECMELGRYESATYYLEIARDQFPEDQMVVLHLAESCDRSGDKLRALRLYESVEDVLNDVGSSVSLRRHRERFARLRASGI